MPNGLRVTLTLLSLLLSVAPPAARADDAEPAAPAPLFVPAGTELLFEMGETVSSKTHERGDAFALRLAVPLEVDGQVLIPAGTAAVGEVVHAAKSAFGGQAGELILAARHVDFAGRQIPLRAFQTGVGNTRVNQAMAVAIALGPAGMLVRGKHVEIAAGGLINAKLKTDLLLPPLPAADPLATPALPATPATPAAHAAAIPETTNNPGELPK